MNERPMNSEKKLHLIYNSKSGRGQGPVLRELAERICKELNWEFIGYEIEDPKDIEQLMKKAVIAVKSQGGTLAAAGGDGTLRAAAQAINGEEIRFAAIPCGTFNLFARTHNVPEDHEQALRLAIQGETQAVRVAAINGEIFLINANLGLYAKAINDRKARTQRWGRHRIVAIISTMMSMIEGHRTLDVDLVIDGQSKRVRTPMIFIGNNALQLRNLSLSVAKEMKKDLLAVFTMKPVNTWGVIRILFRGLAKTLDREEALDSFSVDSLEIHARNKSYKVALDGEMLRLNAPFKVQALPEYLHLVKPKSPLT